MTVYYQKVHIIYTNPQTGQKEGYDAGFDSRDMKDPSRLPSVARDYITERWVSENPGRTIEVPNKKDIEVIVLEGEKFAFRGIMPGKRR